MTRPVKQSVRSISGSFSDAVKATVKVFKGSHPRERTHLKSPLRYPGGKTRGVKEIIKYFPPDLERVCSPFLGGGSIEIELANKGVEVFGYDIFEPVTDFWQILLKDPK